MRAFYTSLMAVLVVMALFWGNCYSCPQILLASAQHGCCHRTKVPKSECSTQSLQSFVKAEKDAPVSIAPVAVATIVPPPRIGVVAQSVSAAPTLHTSQLTPPLRI
jgi:hypothetical protein